MKILRAELHRSKQRYGVGLLGSDATPRRAPRRSSGTPPPSATALRSPLVPSYRAWKESPWSPWPPWPKSNQKARFGKPKRALSIVVSAERFWSTDKGPTIQNRHCHWIKLIDQHHRSAERFSFFQTIQTEEYVSVPFVYYHSTQSLPFCVVC